MLDVVGWYWDYVWCWNTTPNCLTFVKTTAIAYGQKMGRSLKILVLCNSSRFYKRQAIGSRDFAKKTLDVRQMRLRANKNASI